MNPDKRKDNMITVKKYMKRGALRPHHDYLKETLQDWTIEETHHLVTTYLNVDIAYSAFVSYLKQYKLYPRSSITYTPEVVDYIYSQLDKSNKELAQILSEKFDRPINEYRANSIRSWVRKLKRRGR